MGFAIQPVGYSSYYSPYYVSSGLGRSFGLQNTGNAAADSTQSGTSANAARGSQNGAAETAALYGLEDPLKKTSDASGIEDPLEKAKNQSECQTCKNRKYVDGSDEMVSYKTPSTISAGQSAGKVRAHEQEHVANAFTKAADNGGKVLQASVQLKTAVCPECGKTYVAGGTTTTTIKYANDDPYTQNKKSADRAGLLGANLDLAV